MGCSKLKNVPKIPSNVGILDRTFKNCISLESVPEIPQKVTRMIETFSGCTNLTGTITINAKEFNMDCFFHDCFKDTVKPITLTGTSQYLQEIADTANNGNVTVGE